MKKTPTLLTIEARILLILVIMFISWQSTIPAGSEFPFTLQDKVLHFLVFYLLALLVDFSVPQKPFRAAKIVVLLGYGVAIEIAQSFLPYRSCSGADLIADAAGITTYLLSIPLLKRIPFLQKRWKDEV